MNIKRLLFTILKVFEKNILVGIAINGFEFHAEGYLLNGTKLELTAVPAHKCFKETEYADYTINLEHLDDDIWALKLEYVDNKNNVFSFVFDLALETLTVVKGEDKPYEIHFNFLDTKWNVEDVIKLVKRFVEVE